MLGIQPTRGTFNHQKTRKNTCCPTRGMEIGLSRNEECPIHSNLTSMCYNRANPFCNSIRCKAANRTPALRVWRKARPKESICYILKLPLDAFRSTGPKAGPMESICYTGLETAAGPKPAPRSLHVLKLLLGTCRSTAPTAAGPKDLSIVTGLETAVGHFSFHWAQGWSQGISLLRV